MDHTKRNTRYTQHPYLDGEELEKGQRVACMDVSDLVRKSAWKVWTQKRAAPSTCRSTEHTNPISLREEGFHRVRHIVVCGSLAIWAVCGFGGGFGRIWTDLEGDQRRVRRLPMRAQRL